MSTSTESAADPVVLDQCRALAGLGGRIADIERALGAQEANDV